MVSAAERYLRLGLQLGRHVDGIVDAYFGPPELAAAVEAEPPVEPRRSSPSRRPCSTSSRTAGCATRWSALRTYAACWQASPPRTPTRSKGCYGVRPAYTDEAVFAAAHERLEELLPGDGPLAERLRALATTRPCVPPGASSARSRPSSRRRARGRAAWSSCRPAKASSWRSCATSPGSRSATTSATFAAGSPSTSTSRSSAVELLRLAHPRDVSGPPRRALQQGAPARARPRAARGDDRPRADAAVARLGGDRRARAVDLLARRRRSTARRGRCAAPASSSISRTRSPSSGPASRAGGRRSTRRCCSTRHGASEAEAHAYLERWALMTPELATHLIRFLNEPTSRTYVITYSAGRELCDSYVAGEPDALPPPADRAGARPRSAEAPIVGLPSGRAARKLTR